MGLKVIGAGLPRTGTSSLKIALERLLGGPCYHMMELFPRVDTHGPLWQSALDGGEPFDELFDGFAAAIDWPASLFWRELAAKHPDALIVLTRRADTDSWWNSASRTVWESMQRGTGMEEWDAFARGMAARFHPDVFDVDGTKRAYERWNEDVRSSVPPERLLELAPGDGWGPLCAALGMDVPDEPYPHANTTAEFRAHAGWE